MKTIDDLRQDLFDKLGDIDIGKLNMMEMKTYAEVVKLASEIQVKSYAEYLSSIATMGFEKAYEPPTIDSMKKAGEK